MCSSNFLKFTFGKFREEGGHVTLILLIIYQQAIVIFKISGTETICLLQIIVYQHCKSKVVVDIVSI